MKRLSFLLLISLSVIKSQNLEINKIEPPNWWSGHTYNELQLMVYGKNLNDLNVSSEDEYFKISGITSNKNTDYAFINIKIDDKAAPGIYHLRLFNSFGEKEIEYHLKERENSLNRYQGFSNDDVIYLIFPDRFVNGDKGNDFLSNQNEEFEFNSLNGRHGGDIQGMIDRLDYLKDLGVTTIWSTPLVENNMYMSYHGYAATDFYKIDPRHGTNKLYKEFVSQAHHKGLKVILDHVSNHIGINHEWIKSLPTPTWLNGRPGNHLPADHDKIPYVDIHRSEKSLKEINEGWFEDYMPDLNQRDTLLAKYIIQNTIWWIEYSGIDGIREDTYPYANPKFMSEWAAEIFKHYPNFNIVGEVWKGDPAIIASFQTNTFFPREFDTNLPVITDFAFRDVVFDYLSGKSEIKEMYELFGKDFVYANPDNLLVFFDNHDIDRGMYAAKWDLHKFKTALLLTLTTRGIPKLFYGTEIGMDGGGHHGRIRAPFPQDFKGEFNVNLFQGDKLDERKEIFTFLKKILSIRSEYSCLRKGKLTQFQPEEGMYIYRKSNSKEYLIVIINDSEESKIINVDDYSVSSVTPKFYQDLLSGKIHNSAESSSFNINGKSISLLYTSREN